MTAPRDPRKQPMPGDVVIYGPQWQRERVEVDALDIPDMVVYRMESGARMSVDLKTWREWMIGAEVLHVVE